MEKNQRSGCLPALAIAGSLLMAQILAQYSGLSFGCSFLALAACCLLVYYVLTFIKLVTRCAHKPRHTTNQRVGIRRSRERFTSSSPTTIGG